MTTLQEQKDLVSRYYNASFDELLDMTPDVVTDDFVLHDVSIQSDVRGPDELVEYYRSFADGMSEMRIESEGITAEDDTVTVRWTVQGTHDRGPVFGIEPTGAEITARGVDVVRIEDEKLAECWSYYDALGFLMQLGVIDEADLPEELFE